MIDRLQPKHINRRRFISLTAAFGAVSLGGRSVPAAPLVRTIRWQGLALGAEAEIIIQHPDPQLARRLIARSIAEVDRLEQIFSLYRRDSELVKLNKMGRLDWPSQDLLRLLSLSREIAVLSDGAFDVSVQPLWQLYADHFGRLGSDPAGPGISALAAARALVDYRSIAFNTDEVRFHKPGMALTFNGIAQGYITDRVADVLRGGGLDHVLANMGEISATGGATRRPWKIDSPATGGVLDITNGAVATSEGAGTRFDASGRHHHLLNPHSARPARYYDCVTVLAKDAATADGLSTALYMLPPDRANRLLAALPGTRAFFGPTEPSRG